MPNEKMSYSACVIHAAALTPAQRREKPHGENWYLIAKYFEFRNAYHHI